MDYLVDLDVFHGPLDLLLYLVKRDEVDIFDIPVARITEQFLEYLGVMELIDMDRAGDFMVMAATLMELKSRLLLPQDEVAEEQADPRMELVRKLVEYKKFKEASLLLEARAEQQWTRFSRQPGTSAGPDPREQPLRQVELWDLVSAFGRLMRETLALEQQQVSMDQTPVHVYMESIMTRLGQERRIAFSRMFTPPYSRERLVGLFLALLELIRSARISAEQPEPFGEIWLHRASQMGPEGGGATGT
jgi:segregation and condensation protein A